MFGRPRCREWTPLATQQLRLRSLIQIVGYNIRPPEYATVQCSYYLTLHNTSMSAPFFTSERVTSPHPKWKEIDSEITQRMSSTNVVIRIWCHLLQPSNSDNLSEPTPDTIIQTWGVYFSGLRYIGANLAHKFTSDCFKSNTLVFQMQGGYFCSYKSLKLDIIPPENEIEHGSLSSDSSGKTNLSAKATLESKFLHHKVIKESRSVSPSTFTRRIEKEYSKSQSPVDRVFKQNFPTIRSASSLNVAQKNRRTREKSCERTAPESNQIFVHSPENASVTEFTTTDLHCDSKRASQEHVVSSSKIDLSETAENYDLRNETDWVPKYRYLALNFLKSEIRASYNATKLQKLHLLQYSIKKRKEAVQEIKERIYEKSALNDIIDAQMDDQYDTKLRFKSRSQRNLFSPDGSQDLPRGKCASQSDLSVKNGKVKSESRPVSNGPRLTLKLNDLLSFKSKPSPFQMAQHVRLTKQMEILRFKRILLTDERDGKLANLRRVKERHAKLSEENQDLGTELMQDYHALSRQTEQLREARQSCCALRELAGRAKTALAARRGVLLAACHDIYHIEQKDESTWTICGVPLSVCGDEPPRRPAAAGDAAAAGLAAAAVTLCGRLLGQPLRYRITPLGSATRILDVAPDLPDPDIPLYVRGGDVTLFRYGMFLLNKCIAQLLYGRGVCTTDMRPTLANLQRLMLAPEQSKCHSSSSEGECQRAQSLRSLVASDRGKYGRQFNRFKDAVDGQSPQTLMSLQRHRHSRSVGSYHDDNEMSTLGASTTSMMGSEPNIYDNALTPPNSSQMTTSQMKSHNSDSEISRMNEQTKVIFTLGDDSSLQNLESQRLVRISSNNDDRMGKYLDESVKRICSEIKDYCTESDGNADSHRDIYEGFDVAESMHDENSLDVAEYMEARLSASFDRNGGSPAVIDMEVKNSDGFDANGDCETHTENCDIVMEARNSAPFDAAVQDGVCGNQDGVCESQDSVCGKQDGVCESQDGCQIQNGGCQEYMCAKDAVRDVVVIESAEVRVDTGEGDVGTGYIGGGEQS